MLMGVSTRGSTLIRSGVTCARCAGGRRLKAAAITLVTIGHFSLHFVSTKERRTTRPRRVRILTGRLR